MWHSNVLSIENLCCAPFLQLNAGSSRNLGLGVSVISGASAVTLEAVEYLEKEEKQTDKQENTFWSS